MVDDHELVRNLITSVLENAGFRVRSVGSGRAAIEAVRENGQEIGCVIQDLSMPQMSGKEVIAELLKLQPGLPVIVLSVDEESYARALLGDLGIAGYVQKPFEPDQLVASVMSCVSAAD